MSSRPPVNRMIYELYVVSPLSSKIWQRVWHDSPRKGWGYFMLSFRRELLLLPAVGQEVLCLEASWCPSSPSAPHEKSSLVRLREALPNSLALHGSQSSSCLEKKLYNGNRILWLLGVGEEGNLQIKLEVNNCVSSWVLKDHWCPLWGRKGLNRGRGSIFLT